jgi:hypothetical protein
MAGLVPNPVPWIVNWVVAAAGQTEGATDEMFGVASPMLS